MAEEKKGRYKFNQIEKKWQDYWFANKTFKAEEDSSKPKYYVLDMFPYPSAQGLHVGHPEGYTASDIIARYKRMQGFSVLHPIGWDAFGLPAEQYAIKTGTHPAETTKNNVDNMRRQIKSLGFSYDWDRQVNTTDPGYYKWTQWIFLKFYNSYFDDLQNKARPISQLLEDLKANRLYVGLDNEIVSADKVDDIKKAAGLTKWSQLSDKQQQEFIDNQRLAFEANVAVNWCPELGTVLANEEVVGGVSERGGYPVIRKPMRQWMLRITKYADRLLDDLDKVDWPYSIKKLQSDWIGKSRGAEVDFAVDLSDESIKVFTTRPDTLFGATYMVLAPEHPLVDVVTAADQKKVVEEYKHQASMKSDLDRTDLAKEKTGVFTGGYAVNPVNNKKIPIWISDYVLISYGTGAIMAVPAHDQRDYEFAKQFGLDIIEVVRPEDPDLQQQVAAGQLCFDGDGIAVNSGKFDGLKTAQFKKEIVKYLNETGKGKAAVNYKLRDWLFSRQRYWGEPFPIIHMEDGRRIALDESQLPLIPPYVDSYKPSGTGQSPLANVTEWVNVVVDGKKGKRETNTMPQWAGSCWYYLRYTDASNDKEPFSSDKEKYWLPVDLYIGGAEHAVLHLLYSRFWHKLLYDLGYVSVLEPFKKLVNQGMILGQDGQKMSKSRGNVVNPDNVISDYGADAMRLYEMFMGPLEASKPWSMNGVEGVYRFLKKVWRMIIDEYTDGLNSSIKDEVKLDTDSVQMLHKTIKKVTLDIDNFSFNTAISQMMIFVNHFSKLSAKPKSAIESFVKLLSPLAPHITEELWLRLGNDNSLAYEKWPEYDEELTKQQEIELAVQVLGKIKDKIVILADASDDDIKQKALESEKVKAAINDRDIRKIIVIKSRLVNIVV